MRLVDVGGVLHQHEPLMPGEGAFDRGDIGIAVVAQVEAGRIPAQAGGGAIGGKAGIGLVLARPPLHHVALGLDGLGQRDVPQLDHGTHVGVAVHPRPRQLAGGIQPAAHRGQRRMRAQRDLVVGAEQIAQRRRRGQLGVGGVHHQRLGAPVRRHVFQHAAGTRAFARGAIGQAGQVVVHRQLGFVPGAKQAVRIPGADAVDGGLDHVDAAGFQRDLAFGEHRVLVGQFLEVHLDAGRGLEGRKDLLGQRRITGPAGEVQLARRGKRLGRDDRRSGKKRPRRCRRSLQKTAAGMQCKPGRFPLPVISSCVRAFSAPSGTRLCSTWRTIVQQPPGLSTRLSRPETNHTKIFVARPAAAPAAGMKKGDPGGRPSPAACVPQQKDLSDHHSIIGISASRDFLASP
jgi:hypothetical protein